MPTLFCTLLAFTPFFVLTPLASPVRAAELIFLGTWVVGCLLVNASRSLYLSSLHIGATLFFLLLVISSAFAGSPVEAWRFSLAFLPFLGLSLLTTAVGARDRFLLFRLARILLASGLVAAVLGLYEFSHFWLLGPTPRMLIPFVMPPDNSIRVGGMFGQPNLFALYLLLVLVCFFLIYLHDEAPPNRRMVRLRFLPVVLVATVFFLTGSRSGFVAGGVVFLFLVWLVNRGKYLEDGQKPEFFRLLACLVLGLVAARYLPDLLTFLTDFFSEPQGTIQAINTDWSLHPPQGDSGSRWVLWTSTLLMFLHHPWLGIGPDNFKLLQASYQVQAHDLLGFVTYENFGYGYWAHNEILQLMAELGIGGLLFALWLGFYLLRIFRNNYRAGFSVGNVSRLYLLLLLLSILVYALFSRPLRQPGLLSFFVVFLSLLPAATAIHKILVPRFLQGFLVLCLLAGLVGVGIYGYDDYRLGQFAAQVRYADRSSTSFETFEKLAERPFLEFRVLLKAVPTYVANAVAAQDKELAHRVLPYARRLAKLQGAYWQWYDLARVYYILGNNGRAALAIQRAIDLQPAYEPAWQLQHRLNAEEAAQKTGFPIEHFFPELKFDVNALLPERLNDPRN